MHGHNHLCPRDGEGPRGSQAAAAGGQDAGCQQVLLHRVGHIGGANLEAAVHA